MQDEYITSSGGCQPPYWERDAQGRISHKYTREELPLIDRTPTGKVRPWRKHKMEAAALAEVYAMLAERLTLDAPEPPGVTFEDMPTYDPETLEPDGGVATFAPAPIKDSGPAAKYLDKARRLSECARIAEFERLPDGQLRLHNSSFCRVRLCPMCQWRRSLKLGAQVRQVVETANAEHIAETGTAWRWLMVTFTVRNVPGSELGGTIDQLHKGVVNMSKCKRWRGAVRGWLRATEVTHCTSKTKAAYDTYHPHIHALLCVPSSYFKSKAYIRQAEWAQMWGHYAGVDYTPVVDVRTIKAEDGSKVSDLPPDEQAAAMGKAVAEVSKYAAKPADYIVAADPELTLRTVETLDAMLHHRRMTSWGGILKDIAKALHLDDPETGDLIHIDQQASTDSVAEQAAQYVTYGWAIGARDYIHIAERQGADPATERQQAKADRRAKRQHERQQAAAEVQQDLDVVDLYLQARGAWDAKARKIAIYELRTLPRWQIEQRIRDYHADITLPDDWEVEP